MADNENLKESQLDEREDTRKDEIFSIEEIKIENNTFSIVHQNYVVGVIDE